MISPKGKCLKWLNMILHHDSSPQKLIRIEDNLRGFSWWFHGVFFRDFRWLTLSFHISSIRKSRPRLERGDFSRGGAPMEFALKLSWSPHQRSCGHNCQLLWTFFRHGHGLGTSVSQFLVLGDERWMTVWHHLTFVTFALLNLVIFIVDLPIEHGDILMKHQ